MSTAPTGARHALVLCGGNGLGGAIARNLHDGGFHVSALDKAFGDAQRASSECAFTQIQTDVTDRGELAGAIERAVETNGHVDTLVNITPGPPPGRVLDLAWEDWERAFALLIGPVIEASGRLVPAMAERGFGRVITSTSSGVTTPIPNLGLSNALRSALVGWSKTLAGEVAERGVTCNVLVPGRIGTARVEQLDRAKAERDGRSEDEVRAASMKSIPLGRYGEPDEYASMAGYLASSAASYVTGAVLRVDGGLISSV